MTDAQDSINEPLTDALDGIVFRAVLSFVAVAVITAVPLLLHLPPGIHEAAHAVLPACWAVYAGLVYLRLRGVPAPADDPWSEARQAEAGGAGAARLAYVALPIGWLAAAAGLVAHHLSTTAGAAEVIGIDVPILGVTWLLAVIAWQASTHAAIASAEEARNRRLRSHLERLRQAR